MNVSKPPFDNKALRQAVAWALDRDEIRTVAYFGAGETGSEEVPTGSKWYDGQDPYQAGPDIDKAKSLMQAGRSRATASPSSTSACPSTRSS